MKFSPTIPYHVIFKAESLTFKNNARSGHNRKVQLSYEQASQLDVRALALGTFLFLEYK